MQWSWKRVQAGSVAFFVLAIVACPKPAVGLDWVDDWLANSTQVVSAPASFKGVKRTYLDGGAMKVRFRPRTDYPITISKPRVSASCGGIDMFMGGFGMLNAEYLVEKMQNMVKAAPAIAFSLAMQVLSEQLDELTRGFEGIVDVLNQLQMDDCNMTRTVMADVVNLPGGGPFRTLDTGKEVAKKIGGGVADMWHGAMEDFSAREWRMSGQDFLDGLSGCPAGFRAVFGGGSVLENLRERFNIKKEYADLVRGMIGDVVVESDEAGVVARSISPCAGNMGGNFLDSAVDGAVQIMEWDEGANREGECGGPVGENSNLGEWVNSLLESIWQKKLAARTEGAAPDYTSEELDLLFHSWIDLDGLMELEMDGQAGFGDAMGDYQVAIAKDYAYQVYSDVLVKAREVLNAGLKTWDDEGYPLRAAGHLACNVKPVENVKVGLKAMQTNIQDLETGKLRQELLAAMEEVNIQVDVNKKITEVRRERRRQAGRTMHDFSQRGLGR